MNAPTIKQSLADLVLQRFPWLAHVVTVASAKGKGLAIRTASGLLHLAGGPGDPAVHRKGDHGWAGTIVLDPPGIGPYTGFRINSPDGSSVGFTFVSSSGTISVTSDQLAGHRLVTEALEGSEKVTCA